MLLESTLPTELVNGGIIRKLALNEIDELQNLYIPAFTSIKMHGHNEGQWEIWVISKKRKAYICMPNQEHEFINLSKESVVVLAIKGTDSSSYEDLAFFVESFGFNAERGSVIIDD